MVTTNKFRWHVWRVLTVDGPHWACQSPRQHEFPGSTLLRLQGALQWHCPKWTLCFMYFPGLSCSGSRVFARAQTQMGCGFCDLPGPNCSGNWVVGKRTVPGGPCIHALSNLGDSVSWVCHEGTVPGVPCVSSGELISGCDTPGRCEPSRIPGRRHYQLAACLQFGGRCGLWG